MTTKARHTPGPWKLVRFSVGSKDGARHICEIVGHGGACIEQDLYNSLLIAAAPDLLEALQLISDQCDMDSPTRWKEARLMAKQAIDKATGTP